MWWRLGRVVGWWRRTGGELVPGTDQQRQEERETWHRCRHGADNAADDVAPVTRPPAEVPALHINPAINGQTTTYAFHKVL